VIRARDLWSSLVSKFKKRHPALKHGAYSSTAVLPGENQAEFDELYQALIAEWAPTGVLQEHTVADIARLLWRKQNLGTFLVAELARKHRDAIQSERAALAEQDQLSLAPLGPVLEPHEREAAIRAAEAQPARNLARPTSW
jgi:hypothetical protein